MAGAIIQIPANGANDYSDFVTAMQAAIKGSLFVSLSNFTGNSAPEVEDGSYCDINGAIYKLTPNGSTEAITGLAAIANSSTIYFYAVPSGSSVTCAGSITAPTWSETKGGFYNSNDRCFGGCYKDGSGNYTRKWVINNKSETGLEIQETGDLGISFKLGKIATGGETAPDCVVGGITLNTSEASSRLITLKNTALAHGITNYIETDTGGEISTTNAGQIAIYGATTAAIGINLLAFATTENTATSTAATGNIHTAAWLKNGTAATSHQADANLFVIQNYTATKFIVKGDGDIYYDGADQGAYDKENDFDLVQEAHDLQKTEKPEVRKQLEKLGIIQNGFISNRKMTFLQLGTMNKMIKILKKLGEKLGLTEEELLALANE